MAEADHVMFTALRTSFINDAFISPYAISILVSDFRLHIGNRALTSPSKFRMVVLSYILLYNRPYLFKPYPNVGLRLTNTGRPRPLHDESIMDWIISFTLGSILI